MEPGREPNEALKKKALVDEHQGRIQVKEHLDYFVKGITGGAVR